MFCVHCGKEIPEGSTFCPECGKSQQESADTVEETRITQPASTPLKKAKYNTLCIVGIVVGIISWFLNFWGITGIAAVVISVLGLANCKQKNENGRILAILGIVSGGFNILYAYGLLLNLL